MLVRYVRYIIILGFVYCIVQVLDSEAMPEPALRQYLDRMSQRGTWGDGTVLSAAARLYNRPILILGENGQQNIDTSARSSSAAIQLGLIRDRHYVSLVKSSSNEAGTNNNNDNENTATEASDVDHTVESPV